MIIAPFGKYIWDHVICNNGIYASKYKYIVSLYNIGSICKISASQGQASSQSLHGPVPAGPGAPAQETVSKSQC